MTNKHLLLAGIVAVVVVALGWFAFTAVNNAASPKLGATIGYQSSLGNQLTFNAFNSLLQDLIAVRAPLAGVLSTTTASISFPSIASTTDAQTSTNPVLAAQMNDIIIVTAATTSPGIYYTAIVTTPSTTAATFQLNAHNATAAAVTPSSTTFTIYDLPAASFKAPAAIVTATSSSSN